MDFLVSFFFIIIATILGISIGLLLDIRSYLKIAFIVLCLFIPMELYNNFVINRNKSIPRPNSQPNSQPNTTMLEAQPNTTMLQAQPNITMLQAQQNTPTLQAQPNTPTLQAQAKFARQKDLDDTKYGIFKHTASNGEEKDALPLDGLDPQTLLSKLNYIHYATSNPYKPITYTEYKTHADKYLDQDGTKLSAQNIDPVLLSYSKAHYPQLTNDQIDARDCLNNGSSKDSCFQSAQLFYNVKNNFTILNKGVNEDNANLIIKEDFCNSMILDPNQRYQQILFKNAPSGNLDVALDSESNERIHLNESTSLCRHCKLAKCSSDYCSLQNNLFM